MADDDCLCHTCLIFAIFQISSASACPSLVMLHHDRQHALCRHAHEQQSVAFVHFFTKSVNKEEQIVAAATLIVSVRLLIIFGFSHLCSFHPRMQILILIISARLVVQQNKRRDNAFTPNNSRIARFVFYRPV